MMKAFVHPTLDQMNLTVVLGALADPMRLEIIRRLMEGKGECRNCTDAAPCENMAKSTLSNHFRILREAGIIQTVKKGVENQNSVRTADMEKLFPGLLTLVMKLAAKGRI
jgi:DNA-binding transcriptional ArsR family regulator